MTIRVPPPRAPLSRRLLRAGALPIRVGTLAFGGGHSMPTTITNDGFGEALGIKVKNVLVDSGAALVGEAPCLPADHSVDQAVYG